MRLEPVYLLAPKPKPPSIPTRRAFLVAGGTLLAGLGVGAASGYAAAASAAGQDGEQATRYGDPSARILDELHRLAVDAPIDELVARWIYFVDSFGTNYREDPILPEGMARLCESVLTEPSLDGRALMALSLSQAIERAEPEAAARLDAFLPALREVR